MFVVLTWMENGKVPLTATNSGDPYTFETRAEAQTWARENVKGLLWATFELVAES